MNTYFQTICYTRFLALKNPITIRHELAYSYLIIINAKNQRNNVLILVASSRLCKNLCVSVILFCKSVFCCKTYCYTSFIRLQKKQSSYGHSCSSSILRGLSHQGIKWNQWWTTVLFLTWAWLHVWLSTSGSFPSHNAIWRFTTGWMFWTLVSIVYNNGFFSFRAFP